jgi:hypothetical protein
MERQGGVVDPAKTLIQNRGVWMFHSGLFRWRQTGNDWWKKWRDLLVRWGSFSATVARLDVIETLRNGMGGVYTGPAYSDVRGEAMGA